MWTQLDEIMKNAMINVESSKPEPEETKVTNGSIVDFLKTMGTPDEALARVTEGLKTFEAQFGSLEGIMEKAEGQFKSYISGIIREAIRDMVPEMALALGSIVIEDQLMPAEPSSKTEEDAVSLREEINRLEASLQDT